MIVKNEAANIARAVLSARRVADEIIILDTGSTDETLSILTAMGQPFFTTSWRDSFSIARNESLSKATKPWILWMDADDVITEDAAIRIRALKEKPLENFYLFYIKNIDPLDPEIVGQSSDDKFMQFRMFPNFKGLSFDGRVHEQIAGEALGKLACCLAEDVVIEHHGYSSRQHIKESLRRNIRLQMISMGFPANTDFFEFMVGEDIYCIYHPNTIAVWYKKHYMTHFNPFEFCIPETAEERFQVMKKQVKVYLQSHLDGLRVSLTPDFEQWVRDIEKALKTGEVNVCPIA